MGQRRRRGPVAKTDVPGASFCSGDTTRTRARPSTCSAKNADLQEVRRFSNIGGGLRAALRHVSENFRFWGDSAKSAFKADCSRGFELFRAELPLCLMECAGWLLIRLSRTGVLRSFWALPTTISPTTWPPSNPRDRRRTKNEQRSSRAALDCFRRPAR